MLIKSEKGIMNRLQLLKRLNDEIGFDFFLFTIDELINTGPGFFSILFIFVSKKRSIIVYFALPRKSSYFISVNLVIFP